MMIKFINKLEKSTSNLFLALIVIRCIDSLLINTFFDPDEYWQSLEVAHKMVFGYGEMTWEWKEMIRSYLHPLLFAIPFKILSILNLDTTTMIIVTPKLLQGFLSAIGDLYLYKLSCLVFNRDVAKWALISQLISWYTFVCIVRTYSNSIETILFIVSLYYWPIADKSRENQMSSKPVLSIILTTIAFLIRPTTAIMWLYLIPSYIITLYRNNISIASIIQRLFKLVMVSIIVIILNVGVDYYFYGKLTFVPYNFLYFNVTLGVSKFYGTHPFHWYFTQGLPTIAFTSILFFVLAYRDLYKDNRNDKLSLANMTIFSVALYSVLAHKEFRFIFPILPIIMMYSGFYLNQLFPSTKSMKSDRTPKQHYSNRYKKFVVFLLLLNIPMIVFFSNFHQRSPIDIMHYINSNINTQPNSTASIHFLMSCHATPLQSYVHNPNIHLKLLQCPPPLRPEDPKDEKSVFFENPLKWMIDNYQFSDNYKAPLELPDYFIVRDDLVLELEPVLLQNNYSVEHVFKRLIDITSSTLYKRIK
ncbi:putative transmembrane protein [Tieghemostelium lacteum]|uniref:Mannosyltransferase n=1 Tax=Tieghemostelium lacteum TaxID=361077 RepID=A0A152A6E5_TIELA|nr:putative transmembrane protein [Tieghemostelium lacteum]|eukprot:KYR01681.1 putative transmembrane protein [Tieghemostelium lacteum]